MTNELNNEVGVAVPVGNTGGSIVFAETNCAGVVSATGNSITVFPPKGVGVWYCPHSDEEFPPHDESISVVRIKRTAARFTLGIIPLMVKSS